MHALAALQTEPAAPLGANDHIQIALIGAGIQGQGDTKVAVQVPGVKLVAVADCYDGRLAHSKELWGNDVFGKTLGIIGFGRIGRAMARRALGFGMRVLYQDAVAADPATEQELRATRTDTATLLRESDFVSLHTPLLPETQHLINAKSLRTMKKTAYLINASRGPVVDEAALAQALKEGWIAGAGIDVFEREPEVHPALMGLPNVVLAPHIASASSDTRLKMANLAVDNCLAVLEGKTPPTPVNPEVFAKR